MISLENKAWLHKESSKVAIQPIETFIVKGSDISLKAAKRLKLKVKRRCSNTQFQSSEQWVQFCSTVYRNEGGT